MDERESDPTGAFHGGGSAQVEKEPHVREHAARPDSPAESTTPGVDDAEREVVTSGTAATSEVADRDAQEEAEGAGDGPPLPR